MSQKKLSDFYKKLFEEEEKIDFIQDDESFSPEILTTKIDDDSRVSRAGFQFILSNNLMLPGDAFSPIEKGEFDDRTSSALSLDLSNTSSDRKFLNELHNSLFLSILWQASASSDSSKFTSSSAESLLRKYNAAGFGEISEEFFGKLLNLSGNNAVNLNDFLASGNTEFADVYTSKDNTSWSLKMSQQGKLGDQNISYLKLFKAFMKNKDSTLRQTNAGIIHLEPSGNSSNPSMHLNIYGPRTIEELKEFESDINKIQQDYFKNNVELEYTNIFTSDDIEDPADEDNYDFVIEKENLASYSEFIDLISQISSINKEIKAIQKYFNQTDSFYKELKREIDNNNKAVKELSDDIISKIHDVIGYYDSSEKSIIFNPNKLGSYERSQGKNIEDVDEKSIKTRFSDDELVYIFGRRTFKIDIPSNKEINDSIDNWVDRSSFDIKKPENGDWVNSIISQLMGRGKVKDDYFKLFPFLLTAGGSEISKSRRSANYWSKLYRDIDLNDKEISSGIKEKDKKLSLDNLRKGWNDLRNVVDNTINDEENFDDYDQKYKRLDWLGSLLSDKAEEIDNTDVVKNNKVSLKNVPDSELNKHQYELEDSYGIWHEEEDEESSNVFDTIRKKLKKQADKKASNPIERIKSKRKNSSESFIKKYSLKAALLNEGMFHMMHPYEYHLSNDYKLSDILTFIDQLEEGTLEISEKLDGQNLWFTVVNGIPLFGYSLKELKTGFKSLDDLATPEPEGSERKLLGIEKIMKTPGHGGKKSFGDGIEIVDSAIKAAYYKDENTRNKINSIFENGSYVVSSEVIHKEGPNQILYGENFIAPHFVMDKTDNSHNIEKYNDLFDVLIQGIEMCNNPDDFKILTRQQRNALGSDISIFDSDEDKQRTIDSLRSEYNRQILRLIEGTRLTIDSSIKDFYKEKVRNLCENPPGSGSPITLNEKDLDSLTSYVGGVSLKDSGLKSVPDYKNILSSLNLNNAANRKDFYRNNITPLIELFFDFGIDVVRNLKTTAASAENRDTAHTTIVETNIYNIKKALIISRDFKEYHENLSQEELEQLDYYKDAVSLLKTINSQIPKMKKTIHRVSQKENISKEEALRLVCSSSIEGLVFKKTSSIDDSVLEMKLTGFFAPLNQLLNAIRFKVNNIPMLQNYLEQDGKIFSFTDKDHDISNIETLLESRLILSLRHIKSLKEIYNPRTYGSNEPFEEEINEFDIACIPMSAKPFTRGHLDLVKKACERSKEVFVVASITDRARSKENPVFGRSMEKVLFNKGDIVTSLEDKLNDLDICRDKVTVVASKNPFIDVITIFGKDFFEEYMDLNKKYAIFVGDKEDGTPYKEEMLDHIGEKLNVLYRQENSERLSSGTQTREHLNTGLKFSEVIKVLKSGKEKLQTTVDYHGQSEEGSDEYERSLGMFSDNLPEEIYTPKEIALIYDTISNDSHKEIKRTLSGEEGEENPRVVKALSKKGIKNLRDVYKNLQ